MILRLSMTLACLFWLPACAAMADPPATATSIYEQNWQLRHSQQGSLGLTLNDQRPPFTLVIRRDGSARGQVACNTWAAQARVGPDLVRLERVVTSRAQCHFDDRRVAALAGRYLNGLQRPSHYELRDNQLHIRLQNGETWRFIPAPEPSA